MLMLFLLSFFVSLSLCFVVFGIILFVVLFSVWVYVGIIFGWIVLTLSLLQV